MFNDGPQPAGAGAPLQGALGDGAQRMIPELQFDPLHREEFLVLLHQGVLRLGEDLDERARIELVQDCDDRQAAHEFGNQAVLDEVLGLDVVQQLVQLLAVVHRAHVRAEAHAGAVGAVLDDLLQAPEGAPADEEDVGGVDLHELLVRVLAPALGRHRSDRALDQLQERLLHALARHVAGDGGVVALPRDLVDLVDVDDAALRLLDVVVALLQQLLDDVLDVLADVARFRERRRVRDHEGDVQQARERLREQRLARARGADQQDVRLGQLDVVLLAAALQALVVVVDRDREDLLGLHLADHVLVEDLADLVRAGKVALLRLLPGVGRCLFTDDVVAEVDALVADEDRRAGDELAHFMLALAAEGAIEKLFAADLVRHVLLDLPQVTTASRRFFSTRSIKPYFTASSAPMKLSRSVSRSMTSMG